MKNNTLLQQLFIGIVQNCSRLRNQKLNALFGWVFVGVQENLKKGSLRQSDLWTTDSQGNTLLMSAAHHNAYSSLQVRSSNHRNMNSCSKMSCKGTHLRKRRERIKLKLLAEDGRGAELSDDLIGSRRGCVRYTFVR